MFSSLQAQSAALLICLSSRIYVLAYNYGKCEFAAILENKRINGVNGYILTDDIGQEFVNSKEVGSDGEKCQKENRKANSVDEVITRVCALEK